MAHDDLKTRFNNADEATQDSILRDIINENNGYSNEDLKTINLERSHIEKITSGFPTGGTSTNGTIGIVALISALRDDITDETWKIIFDKNYRVIKVCTNFLDYPLPDHVFEHALKRFFESGEKLTIDNEDGFNDSGLSEILNRQHPLSEQCYKLIVDYNIEYIPFIEQIPDNVKEYIFKVINRNNQWFDVLKINEYDDIKKCEIIEQHPYLYQFIENPSEKVNYTLVYNNPYLIQFVEHQTEWLQMKTLSSSHIETNYIFSLFKNPSRKVQYQAVKQDGEVIKFIDNPEYEFQRLAIDHMYENIVNIDKPCENIMAEVLQYIWDNVIYSIVKDNIHRYSDDFKHYFNKLKLKNGIPE